MIVLSVFLSLLQVDTVKRMCVKRLPKVLVIQLKRFDYDWERLVVQCLYVFVMVLIVKVVLIVTEKWPSSLMTTLNFHESWTCLPILLQLLQRRKVCQTYLLHDTIQFQRCPYASICHVALKSVPLSRYILV